MQPLLQTQHIRRTSRIRPVALAVGLAVAALSGCGTSNSGSTTAASSPLDIRVLQVPMRDGVELYTEILLPEGAEDAPVPTLLLRTPYDLPTLPIGGLAPDSKDEDEDDAEEPDEDLAATRAAWLPVLDRGYAVVFQNLRGTQSSGGVNRVFGNEREDGVDTLDWIRSQPWSNGRVGAMGDSAAAFSLHLLAAEQPVGLEATFSQVSCGDIWGSAILPGNGGLKLEAYLPFMLAQSLETGEEHLASLGIGDEAIASAQLDVQAALGALFGDDVVEQFAALTVQPFVEYPGVSSLLPRWGEVLDESARADLSTYYNTRGASQVPGMHVTMWQDVFAECAIDDFQALADGAAEQRLLVLDGSHYQIDDSDSWPYLPMLNWFDRHLMGAPDDAIPSVQYAVQSADSVGTPSRELIGSMSWPPADVIERSYVLTADGGLSTSAGNADINAAIVADPFAPQSTTGGRNLTIQSGIAELEELANDGSERIFTTTTFEQDATIAGEVRLDTLISTDVADVDVHARLVEVTADDRRILIVAGMQRARYRNDLNTPIDLMSGVTVPMTVILGDIAHRIKAGSRLQLELTTSDFPAWDLNPQTGGSPFTATDMVTGTLNVIGTASVPARLSVPFLP